MGQGSDKSSGQDETLKAWAQGLESSSAPGAWAVRWVQGAVAAAAQQVNISLEARAAVVSCYGGFSVQARSLAEQFVNGRIPTAPELRYWVSALDGLEQFPGRLYLSTRSGTVQQVATLENGSLLEVTSTELQGAAANLILRLEPAKRSRLGASPWNPERSALQEKLAFCPIPVLLGKTLISGRTAYQRRSALMNWMEPAAVDERSFLMQGDPQQILAPGIVSPRGITIAPHRCSMMVTLARAKDGRGAARVYWLHDGALTSAVRVAGETGALEVDIVCPGDRPGLSLRQWYELDPASLFAESRLQSIVLRLAGGLDSMAQQAKAQDRPIDELIRRGKSKNGWAQLLPILGRPYNALGGSFHQAVTALARREKIELLRG